MTTEEIRDLELLLKDIPELQPPAGMEQRFIAMVQRRRVQGPRLGSANRSVQRMMTLAACLLFCLGVAALIAAPRGWHRNPFGAPAPDGELRVDSVHDGECVDLQRGGSCRNEAHWKVRVGDRPATAIAEAREILRKEAAPTVDGLSEHQVLLCVQDSMPWSFALRMMQACSQAGLYKIDWASPEKKDARIKAWLPEVPEPRPPERVILEEIRIVLRWDGTRGETVRKIGHLAPVQTDDQLIRTILRMTLDYQKAGKKEWPVFIDPGPDVPWREVMHILEMCRKEKLDRIEFFPSVYRRGIMKNPESAPVIYRDDQPARAPAPDSAEALLAEVRAAVSERQPGPSAKALSAMIVRYPESASTIRAYTLVRSAWEGTLPEGVAPGHAATLEEYRSKWLSLAPAVYDALRPRNLIGPAGVIDGAVLAKAPDPLGVLSVYLEEGHVLREVAKTGKKFQYDNASAIFSNVLRVVAVDSEPWWYAKYAVLATLYDRGQASDIQLAKVGLENLERSTPEFDSNKFGMKDRFLALKKKIAQALDQRR